MITFGPATKAETGIVKVTRSASAVRVRGAAVAQVEVVIGPEGRFARPISMPLR